MGCNPTHAHVRVTGKPHGGQAYARAVVKDVPVDRGLRGLGLHIERYVVILVRNEGLQLNKDNMR